MSATASAALTRRLTVAPEETIDMTRLNHLNRLTLRVLAAGALLLASPWGARAQSAEALAKQVVDVEHAYAAAFQACKPDALDKLTTKDFTFTDYNGMTYSRNWFLSEAEGCTRNVVRVEPMRVTFNDGDNTAIVQSRLHQFVGDKPMPVNLLMHVLIRRDGEWKVALHHSNVMMKSGSLGNQYKLPNSGEAFVLNPGGGAPSTKSAPAFAHEVVRYDGDPAKNLKEDPIKLEKMALDKILEYASVFQNCRTADLQKILSPTYLISGFNGATYTRDWMIATSDHCYHNIQRIEPLQVRLYGENTAILIGRYHQFVYESPTDFRHLTSIAFREEGTWKVAIHYSTTFNEKVGSPYGKLFYSEGGMSQRVMEPFPNHVPPFKPRY